MPTKGQVAQQMALEFGEMYADTDVKVQLQAFVQEVYEYIVEDANWFFRNSFVDLFPINVGQGEYKLPANVAKVRDIFVPVLQKQISYTPVERLHAHGFNLTEPGEPIAWYIAGVDDDASLKIQFYPIPDDEFVTKLHSDMANHDPIIRVHALLVPKSLDESDLIPLPAGYIRVLREGVRARMRYQEGDLQGAAAAQQMFHDGLERLSRAYHGPEGMPSRMRAKMARANRQAPTAQGGA